MMPLPALLLLLLPYLVPHALSFPTPPPQSPPSNSKPEPWLIPRLEVHYMLSPSPKPPAQHDFPSTIDFDIRLPSGDANCKTSWPNGTLPVGNVDCARAQKDGGGGKGENPGRVYFSMARWDELGLRRPEISFALSVGEVRDDV